MMIRILITAILSLSSLTSLALTDEEYFAQIDRLESELETLERAEGPFSDLLFKPLVALAELHISEGDYESAIDSLQRAQNISHRNDGVYTPRQLPLITMLTNMALADGNFDDANRQEKFRFHVSHHHLDETDPEYLFAYADMAEWYMNTGQTRQARRLIKEAQAIADRLDRNPLPLAILMNKARRLEGLNTNPKALIATLNNTEKSDRDTLVSAYQVAADSLLLSRKEELAADYFSKAAEVSALAGNAEPQPITMRRALQHLRADTERYRFETDPFNQARLDRMTREEMLEDVTVEPQFFLMNADQSQQGFDMPEGSERTNPAKDTERLVGDPLMFSEEQLFNILPASVTRRLGEIRIEASFTVKTNGDLANIEIKESSAPNKLNRLIMDALRRVYYRPALENGIPVERDNVRLIQTFDSTFSGV